VDGEAQTVEQVADMLRGVRIAPGHHQVVLVYDPASVRWGGWLSLVGWMVVALGGIALLSSGFVRGRGENRNAGGVAFTFYEVEV
jgi:hypothetical protein